MCVVANQRERSSSFDIIISKLIITTDKPLTQKDQTLISSDFFFVIEVFLFCSSGIITAHIKKTLIVYFSLPQYEISVLVERSVRCLK